MDPRTRSRTREHSQSVTWRRVVVDHANVARSFLVSPALRPAILTIWVASFGAALHMPCTAYFYIELGATDVDIGAINTLATVCSLFLQPVYGHVLDTRGPFVPVVVSCAFCALGCLLRGLATNVTMLYAAALVLGLGGANLWTTVLGLVVKRSPRATRSIAVSGFLVQVALLRLVGKLMYRPLDWLILATRPKWTTLQRYRAIMSVCTIFCFFGVFELLRARASIVNAKVVVDDSIILEEEKGEAKVKVKAAVENGAEAEMEQLQLKLVGEREAGVEEEGEEEEEEEEEEAQMSEQKLLGATAAAAAAVAVAAPSSPGKSSRQTLLAVLIALRGCVAACGATLWPLFVADAFDWSAREYAALVVVSSLSATAAVAVAPALERAYGGSVVASAAALVGALAAATGFHANAPTTFHIAAATLFTACVALLEPLLKSLRATAVARKTIAASFGVMATLDGVGAMVGSLGGAALYSAAKHSGSGGGLAAPFLAASALLACIAAALRAVPSVEKT